MYNAFQKKERVLELLTLNLLFHSQRPLRKTLRVVQSALQNLGVSCLLVKQHQQGVGFTFDSLFVYSDLD